uniref:Peptidase S26 domain-containing protein n=1 Tax=Acrobeloides nanus TaxID=290746 RepID=A0A914DED5_9BILA
MSRWIGEPKKDHIYSFKYPRDPRRKHIKRLKYKSGDIVRAKSMETTTIPQKHFWMVSDNRDTGNDSFVYGPVSRGLIEAEAKYIIWPSERIGKIQ